MAITTTAHRQTDDTNKTRSNIGGADPNTVGVFGAWNAGTKGGKMEEVIWSSLSIMSRIAVLSSLSSFVISGSGFGTLSKPTISIVILSLLPCKIKYQKSVLDKPFKNER